MNVLTKDIKEEDSVCDVLILPFCEGEGPEPYKELDRLLKGLISRVMSSGEFGGKHGQLSLLHTMNMIRPARLLLSGLGKRDEVNSEKLRQAGGKALSYLQGVRVRGVSLSTGLFLSLKQSPVPFLEGGLLVLYAFRRYKNKEEDTKGIERFIIILGKADRAFSASVRRTVITSAAVNFAKDLVNTPSNDMTPTALSKSAKAISKVSKGKVSVKVFGRADAEKKGMGAFLSVARGSMEPPKFIVLRYRGGKGAPVALIGKSITFDSGGISIKPSEGME
ncbi:MAG TPA: M17 family peptidase N-terminal domain-containing protein, partial [Thermodesulfovibrionales bacterium]|nr:M17 family peptidase N-terminal domain-containing protein [Thermodesulfovibrionales bacterium]